MRQLLATLFITASVALSHPAFSSHSGSRSGKVVFGYPPSLYPSEVEVPSHHKMILATWFEIPVTGRLDTIYFTIGSSINGNPGFDSIVYVRWFPSRINRSFGPGNPPYPDPCVPWGFYHNTNDIDNAIAALSVDATDTTWKSTVPGSESSIAPFWNKCLFCFAATPMTIRPGVNKLPLDWVPGPNEVAAGDVLFLTIRLESPYAHPAPSVDKPVNWVANVSQAPTPSRTWIFYEHGERLTDIDCGSVPGWYARGGPTGLGDGLALNWWFSMTATGNSAPNIYHVDQLPHTLSTSPRTVTARINDSTMVANMDSSGIATVFLNYSVNGTPAGPVTMMNIGDETWEGEIPGQPTGSNVGYSVIATGFSGRTESSPEYTYRVLPTINPYYRIDTTIAYDWVDIKTTGTSISEWFAPAGFYAPQDIGTAGPIDLDGPFVFFGDTVRYAWVGVDGLLGLSNSPTDTVSTKTPAEVHSPYELPHAVLPRNCVAPYFNNFSVNPPDAFGIGHGAVYYQRIGDLFIVQWDAVGNRLDPEDTANTFQVIFDFADGSIIFQYKDIGKTGTPAKNSLVGIQADLLNRWLFVSDRGWPEALAPRNGRAIRLGTDLFWYVGQSGWNMFSVPVKLLDPSTSATFGSTPVFEFDITYARAYTLEHGRGYWVKLPSAAGIPMLGPPLYEDTITVTRGWNMVGSIADPVAVSNITSDPPGLVTSPFLSYGPMGYFTSPTIEPGRAYWVRASQPGRLILSTSTSPLSSNAIRILPTLELPPSPPAEGDDLGEETLGYSHRYALLQNHPNPFNPTTAVSFSIAHREFVTLKVFDLLGREVATLVERIKEAGIHDVQWNASHLPSGVYLYRLQAGTFVETKRLVLVR